MIHVVVFFFFSFFNKVACATKYIAKRPEDLHYE